MSLGEKVRYLREVEGVLRGLCREMTQLEVIRALKKDQKKSISQSYLSQIESGARPHLTDSTRMLLAKFFKVHPGYLVNDPEGYHTELMSDVRASENTLDLWLINGAERFQRDPRVSRALLSVEFGTARRHAALFDFDGCDFGSPRPGRPAPARIEAGRGRRREANV